MFNLRFEPRICSFHPERSRPNEFLRHQQDAHLADQAIEQTDLRLAFLELHRPQLLIKNAQRRGQVAVAQRLSQCEGLSLGVDVRQYEDISGAPPVTARGMQKTGTIKFCHGTYNASETTGEEGRSVFNWMLEVLDANTPLRKRKITIRIEDGERAVSKWILYNAWPTEWQGPVLDESSKDPSTAIESVTFAFEGIDL